MSHGQTYVCGDVTIHPSAIIAPDVLLQAESGGRIVIAAGVCIGMGTILHAYQGTLEVGESANIGTGVLFVGSGKIGVKACVGSSTTILNANVQHQQVVPAGSLLGNMGRAISGNGSNPSVTIDSSKAPATQEHEVENISDPWAPQSSAPQPLQASSNDMEQPSVSKPTGQVYGRAYVNQLLVKLMPHRQQLEQPQLDD